MTTPTTNGHGLQSEDPWSETTTPTGETMEAMKARASSVLQALPGEIDAAGDAVAGAMHQVSVTVASAPDDSLLVGASIASGLAIGLLLGGGPRLLAAAAVVAAVGLGASLVQRHPGRRRPRPTFARPVMA